MRIWPSRHYVGVLLLGAFTQIAAADDRLAEVQKLKDEYQQAEKDYFEISLGEKPAQEEIIRRYEAFPAWSFLPRFVKLAEAQPDDAAAFECCLWIFDRTRNVGNRDQRIYDADQKAWNIIARHHAQRDDVPLLCFRATEYPARAQQEFLRGLRDRPERNIRGFATLGLAELLTTKLEYIEHWEQNPKPESEFNEHLRQLTSPVWTKEFEAVDVENVKSEAAALFREVLADYADVPVDFSSAGFRNLKDLGQKAGQSLHALEHLAIGCEAPNIVGQDLHGEPLELRDYRGKVVVLSFWFTGCGPCMEFIPTEQRLVDTYKDRPFALLGICGDEAAEEAQKTAEEHGMRWPSWFDGKSRAIVRDWNVTSWPTVLLLDARGRIVAKNPRHDVLEAKIKELLEASDPD